MSIYEKIKNRRKELKISQDELAQMLGYTSRSSISKIESGENDIPQSKVEAFAKALKTTTAYLMGWEEEEKKLKEDPFPDVTPEERAALLNVLAILRADPGLKK